MTKDVAAELNEQLIGVNTLEQLQQVEAELLRRQGSR